MVDEAHATGAIGPGGRGSVAAAGLSGEVDVVVGTLGKALGGYGAYVCGRAELIDYLLNTARPFIFSTAPAAPGRRGRRRGARAARGTARSRVERLQRQRRARCARRCAPRASTRRVARPRSCRSIVGDAGRAMALCERALERGVFAQAIRPPTVPRGNLAPAADGDGDPPRRRAAARRPK